MANENRVVAERGHTLVVIGTATKLIGMIAVADTIRAITVSAIGKLKAAGIEDIVMLTGDNAGTAKKVASQTGVNRYFAELLPQDKLRQSSDCSKKARSSPWWGDGINDAPALASADLGIAWVELAPIRQWKPRISY
ncbi:HAD-IC family P-type ATPase [Brevibacillus brevis]|uniref:HAD-IC family P-type ATPase n=1 Tax=Brevibacillus brevis TaxID=1393 RepID=UPI003D19968E